MWVLAVAGVCAVVAGGAGGETYYRKPAASVPSDVPKRLAFLYDSSRTTERQLRQVRPEDRSLLHRLYRVRRTPTERCPVIMGLIYAGDDQVVGLVERALTEEYRGQTLGIEDQMMLASSMALEMGFLARTNHQALAFLTNAVSIEFWRKHRAWKVEGPGEVDKRCVESVIVALGISGRVEALRLLDRIKGECEVAGREDTVAGAFAEAMFVHESIKRYGVAGFREIYDYDSHWLEMEWIRSPSGKVWNEWRKGFPPLAPAAQPGTVVNP